VPAELEESIKAAAAEGKPVSAWLAEGAPLPRPAGTPAILSAGQPRLSLSPSTSTARYPSSRGSVLASSSPRPGCWMMRRSRPPADARNCLRHRRAVSRRRR
jgi:hypothetical protein